MKLWPHCTFDDEPDIPHQQRIAVFSPEEAYQLFSSVDTARFAIFAINDKNMTVSVVYNYAEACDFYNEK